MIAFPFVREKSCALVAGLMCWHQCWIGAPPNCEFSDTSTFHWKLILWEWARWRQRRDRLRYPCTSPFPKRVRLFNETKEIFNQTKSNDSFVTVIFMSEFSLFWKQIFFLELIAKISNRSNIFSKFEKSIKSKRLPRKRKQSTANSYRVHLRQLVWKKFGRKLGDWKSTSILECKH